MKVFISWSGVRSKAVASALRDWIPLVVQRAEPWMSKADIDAGERWSAAIAAQLSASDFGIVCLTPENIAEPWILFEAGALAKTLTDKTRVCPYLFGLEPTDIPAKNPLSQFQAKTATIEQTRDLLQSLNAALGADALPTARLTEVFDALWEKLEARLGALPPLAAPVEATRSAQDMIPEILEAVRSIERRLAPEPMRSAQTSLADDPVLRSLFIGNPEPVLHKLGTTEGLLERLQQLNEKPLPEFIAAKILATGIKTDQRVVDLNLASVEAYPAGTGIVINYETQAGVQGQLRLPIPTPLNKMTGHQMTALIRDAIAPAIVQDVTAKDPSNS